MLGWTTMEYPKRVGGHADPREAGALDDSRRHPKVRAKNEIDTATDQRGDRSPAAAQKDQLDIKTVFFPKALVGGDPRRGKPGGKRRVTHAHDIGAPKPRCRQKEPREQTKPIDSDFIETPFAETYSRPTIGRASEIRTIDYFERLERFERRGCRGQP